MAKKKNVNAEDEWFEDEDMEAEESKPKKKAGKKKKRTGKAVAWVVAFVVILAILLFIRFKYAAPQADTAAQEETAPEPEVVTRVVPEPEETETADEDEGSVYQEPKYAGPDVVDKEDLPKVQDVIDTTAEPELFSNIKCDYDYTAELLYISLRIYNTLEEDIKISPRGVQKGYNTYFKIRGLVDIDPGCGTELLEPSEYTECTKIGFDNERYGNVEGINRISVQVPGKTEALLVECPAKPSTSSEEE
ncbi:hypothetical protein KY363_01780 [Candidatus Woesearchaeota archaeon]|nr:hypothetical protein [Candidatus Woesearchaeota archaeon]